MTTDNVGDRPSSPLPLTLENVAVGASWTMGIFVMAMGVVGALVGWLIGFVVALFIAGVATLIVTPLLGVPLTLLAARVLHHTPTRWPHLVAQFVVGAAGASIAMSVYLALTTNGSSLYFESSWGAFVLIACATIAGLSSTAGWALALRYARREPSRDRFDTYAEDFD